MTPDERTGPIRSLRSWLKRRQKGTPSPLLASIDEWLSCQNGSADPGQGSINNARPLALNEPIESVIQYAVSCLSEWVPLDASAEKCNVFDIAGILACDDSTLRHEVRSRRSMLREALVTEAIHGSRLAHDALCRAAMALVSRHDSLPVWLGRYVVFVAAESDAPSKRGRKPQTKYYRDTAIMCVIETVAKRYGLDLTRSPATKQKATTESGCSIVQKALARLRIHMSENNVNAIWRDMDSCVDDMHRAHGGGHGGALHAYSSFIAFPRGWGRRR